MAKYIFVINAFPLSSFLYIFKFVSASTLIKCTICLIPWYSVIVISHQCRMGTMKGHHQTLMTWLRIKGILCVKSHTY